MPPGRWYFGRQMADDVVLFEVENSAFETKRRKITTSLISVIVYKWTSPRQNHINMFLDNNLDNGFLGKLIPLMSTKTA